MPLKAGKSDATIRANTAELVRSGYPPAQAYAIAQQKARPGRRRKRGK